MIQPGTKDFGGGTPQPKIPKFKLVIILNVMVPYLYTGYINMVSHMLKDFKCNITLKGSEK